MEITETKDRLRAAAESPQGATLLGEILDTQRARLRAMVSFRMDRRLRQRVNPSDIIQETFTEAIKRLPEYLDKSQLPILLWLRLLAQQKIATLHRHHLGRVGRDAGRDVSLDTSGAIALQLSGGGTDPGDAVARQEVFHKLHDALETMNAVDREVLALRHFEELSNLETAQVLGIEPAAASKRYVRALEKLREIMIQAGT